MLSHSQGRKAHASVGPQVDALARNLMLVRILSNYLNPTWWVTVRM
jgi:hypothetical protein